jgi:hypothetical protein
VGLVVGLAVEEEVVEADVGEEEVEGEEGGNGRFGAIGAVADEEGGGVGIDDEEEEEGEEGGGGYQSNVK